MHGVCVCVFGYTYYDMCVKSVLPFHIYMASRVHTHVARHASRSGRHPYTFSSILLPSPPFESHVSETGLQLSM